MFRRRKHSAFRRASWLALVAILFQVLLPVLHHPAAAMLGSQRDMAGAGNLCLAPIGNPTAPTDSDKAPAHKLPPCPICQTFQMLGAGFVPSSPIAFAAFAATAAAPVPAADTAINPRWIAAGARARAPPLRA